MHVVWGTIDGIYVFEPFWLCSILLQSSAGQSPSRTAVLKLFCMFYPFNKDDYQIYPKYIKWCLFIKKTKETIYISYN